MEGKEEKTSSEFKRKRDSSPPNSPSSPRSHRSPKRAPIDFSPQANSVTPQTIQGQLKHSAPPQFLIDTKRGMYYDTQRKCHCYWSEEFNSFFYCDDANQSYSFADNQWYQSTSNGWQPVSQAPMSTQPQEIKDQEKGLFYDVERGCYYEIDQKTSNRRYEGYDGQWYQLDGTQLKLEVDLEEIIENLNISQLTWKKTSSDVMEATLPGFDGSVVISFVRPRVPSYSAKSRKGSSTPDSLTLVLNGLGKDVVATRGSVKNVKANNKAIAEASKMYDSLPAYQPPAPPPTPEELYKSFRLGDLLYGLDTDRPEFLHRAKGKQEGWKNAYNVVDELNHLFLGCVSGLAYGEMSPEGREFLAKLPNEQQSVVREAANTFRKAFEQYITRIQAGLPEGRGYGVPQKLDSF